MVPLLLLPSSLTLLAITSLLMWYYWSHRKILAVARRLPTAYPALPLLGHAYLIMMGDRGLAKLSLKKIKALTGSGIDAIALWLGPMPFFLLFKPEDIQVVNNCLTLGPEMERWRFFTGNGLVAAPAHIWRVTRRHYQSVFHPRNVELLMPALNQCGRDLALGLSRHVGSVPLDLKNDMAITAFKMVSYLMFGPDFEINMHPSFMLKCYNLIVRIDEIFTTRTTKVWLWPDFIFRTFYQKDLKDFETIIDEFISSACKQVNNEDFEGRNVKDPYEGKYKGEEKSDKKRDDLTYTKLQDAFETLRTAHPEFTLKDFKDEIVSTLITGSDTTQMSTMYCLLALAARPHIQETVHEEILTAMGRHDDDVTREHLKAMTYLDQVVKETLRKFIIVPVLSRTVDREVKLSFGTLPVGAVVMTAVPAVHYNPQLYPDPERFDPDRFTPENVAKRPRGSFIPFLTGPRNCIGQSFVMVEIKIFLVHLIRKYKFSTSVDIDKVEYKPGLAFKPADVHTLNVEHRH